MLCLLTQNDCLLHQLSHVIKYDHFASCHTKQNMETITIFIWCATEVQILNNSHASQSKTGDFFNVM